MSLLAPFAAAAARHPDRPALRFGAEAVTYGALHAAARRFAAGVGPGDRVALRMTNRPEFLEVFLGTVLAGGTAALLDPKWSAAQTAAALETVAPALVVTEEGTGRAGGAPRDGAAAPPEAAPDTPFLIGFTSGTTGRPKAFIRSQGSWIASLAASREEFAIGEADGILVPGPLVHGLGLYAAVEGLCAGAAVHVLGRFDAAAAVDRLAGHALTTLVAVPTMLVALLDAAAARNLRLPALQRVISAGAKLAPVLHDRLAAAFPEAEVFEYYGASELSFVSVLASREGGPADSVGRAFRGVDLAVRRDDGTPAAPGEVGTVWVRSAMLSDGYLGTGDGAGFRRRGDWATVGDLGSLDRAGWLRLAGRAGDMLITGGLNVYPAEVEAVLRSCPDIAEAVVFGLPDPYWGDAVTAVVWWRDGRRGTAEEVCAWCRRHLEAHKCPRRLFAAGTTPLTGSGKIARAALRRWAMDGGGALEAVA
ncbi:class I adenylate-forming enzyme family protein [Azospirillum sp. ST 5-10]|uniref:class I adenylate-forming enzyme family protein n=1 Tax=unclassified Azospirillum TaxID=2630922 RepID=UPI003F4A6208